MSDTVKIVCGSFEKFVEKILARPPEYLAELDPCIVMQDEYQVCVNVLHPAYIAAATKYDLRKLHGVVDLTNNHLLLLAKTRPGLVLLFPALTELKAAPNDCVTCSGGAKAEWHRVFTAVKVAIITAPEASRETLKTAMTATKLRMSYVADDELRTVVF